MTEIPPKLSEEGPKSIWDIGKRIKLSGKDEEMAASFLCQDDQVRDSNLAGKENLSTVYP